jgi:cell division protease FtsH
LYDAPEAEEEVVFTNSKEKNRMTAFHEAGHVVAAEILEPGSVTLASIASYDGGTVGITSIYQTREYYNSVKYMKNRIKVLLGGKAATEIEYGEVDIGTGNDLKRAFKIAARFVDDYCGLGFDSFVPIPNSLKTTDRCADKISFMMESFYHDVKEILAKNRDFVEKIASKLLEKTTIMMSDIQEIKKKCKVMR